MKLNRLIARQLLSLYKRRKRSVSDTSVKNSIKAAKAIVERTKYCFLVTSGRSGWPSARLVEPITDSNLLNFHIGTNPSLRKVEEIESSPYVTLAFADEAKNANLVVYGKALISSEPEHKRKHWKGAWRLFFPNGPQGEDYTVISVQALRAEVLSFGGNVIPEPFGLKPVVLIARDGEWHAEA